MPIKRSNLKTRIKNGDITIGSWITLGHPAIGEIMANAGFDWLTIDMEHSAISISEAQHLIQVIELSGCVPLVRVGCNEPTIIKRVMDAGAHGVIIPQVNSRDDAINAINATKYPPLGTRGVGLGRAQGFGKNFEDYKKWEGDNSIIIVQIEHIEAVMNIREIMSVNGIDGFIIGPYDLSASMGIPGEFNHSLFQNAMDAVQTYIHENSKIIAGFHVVSPDIDLLKEKCAEGYRFLAYSIDTLFLGNGCCKDLQIILEEKWSSPSFVKSK